VEEVRLKEGRSILKCGREEECGRESCLGCGGEVWGGEACGCFGGKGGRRVQEGEGGKEGEVGGERTEEKKREECRLFVERAMSEALIRTVSLFEVERRAKETRRADLFLSLIFQCPRCELGFTKSEACNKMTCPRDGYKMCESSTSLRSLFRDATDDSVSSS